MSLTIQLRDEINRSPTSVTFVVTAEHTLSGQQPILIASQIIMEAKHLLVIDRMQISSSSIDTSQYTFIFPEKNALGS